jgi:1,4-alpha-glucan branching enzyme
MQATDMSRRLPIGAELSEWRRIRFRVWAPRARRVDVVLESGASALSLEHEPDDYHGGGAGWHLPGETDA